MCNALEILDKFFKKGIDKKNKLRYTLRNTFGG
jgi:hypothetical protein